MQPLTIYLPVDARKPFAHTREWGEMMAVATLVDEHAMLVSDKSLSRRLHAGISLEELGGDNFADRVGGECRVLVYPA